MNNVLTYPKGNTNRVVSLHLKKIHPVMIDPVPYKNQPVGGEMGRLVNRMKYRNKHQYRSFIQILEALGRGQSAIFCTATAREDSGFDMVAASLVSVDVDDDHKVTDPETVMQEFGAAGLYYTFSHGEKGNRYRLLFQLDKQLNDEREVKGIAKLIIKELQKKGVPVDSQVHNPTAVARGGIGYVLNDYSKPLATAPLLQQVKQEQFEEQKRLKETYDQDMKPIPFKKLREMAELIGYIPSGTGQAELWKRLVLGIKHYANIGMISDDEGLELYNILSGPEASDRTWNRLKASGTATIGSLVYEAQQRGYQLKAHHFFTEPVPVDYNLETIRVKQYIPTEVAVELLQSKKRILIDSPTGSGKTTAFITAFKKLQSQTQAPHYYILAMPTIALTLQNAHKHKVLGIRGEFKNLFKHVLDYVRKGNRIFVTTYDMTPTLISILKTVTQGSVFGFSLVVDEYHKVVNDWDYRRQAIEGLREVAEEARSFVALSGTTEDIDKSHFDKVVKIDNGRLEAPCNDFAVYWYENRNNWRTELATLIQSWAKHRKLLVFIQSKKSIELLATALRKKGLRVRTVSANTKSNSLYKQLIETEQVPEDTDVILATTVIADGVNILNSLDWEAIAVCNHASQLFNPSAIRQISNRFRNPYRRFSLFLQEPKEDKTDTAKYHIESAYKWRLKVAKRIQREIQEHVDFDFSLFLRSEAEKHYGLYAYTEEQRLKIDELYLRHDVSRSQEYYYRAYRKAFVAAVERILKVKLLGELNVSKAIEENNLDLAMFELEQELAAAKADMDAEEESKREGIREKFTPIVWEAFRNEEGYVSVLKEFKKAVLPQHYKCLERLSRYADFDVCLHIVERVESKRQTHEFLNNINALLDVWYLNSVRRPSKTKTILKKLLELKEPMTSEKFQKEKKRIAKQSRVAVKAVEKVEKLAVIEHERTAKTRFSHVVGLIDLDYLIQKYQLPLRKLAPVIKNRAKSRPERTLKVVVETKLPDPKPKIIQEKLDLRA